MAWLSQFKLGRAGYESLFEINPSAMTFDPNRIEDFGRGLDGSGIDVTLSNNRPRFTINGNYITPAQANQFLSLLHIDYETLVFEPVNYSGDQVYEVWQERVIAKTTTEFTLPENSFTRAARAKQLNGSTAVIRPVGLWAQMASTHGRTGSGVNLISPGLWGNILIEDFNLLPTGLLSAAGANWAVVNGNGGTRDAYVSTTTPIEGAKDLSITSDGSGTPLLANRANGGLWNPNSVFAQNGYLAEFYTAIWQAQVVGTTTNDNHQVSATGITGPIPWTVSLTVTSPTTVDYEFFVGGVSVAGPAALTNPFLAHTYLVVVTPTNIEFKVDAVSVYNQPATIPFMNTMSFMGKGFGAGEVIRYDTIDVTDGDGYDPSRKTFDIVVGLPLVAGAPYWLTYAYNAMAVNMSAVPFQVNGGMVDIVKYNFTLEGM